MLSISDIDQKTGAERLKVLATVAVFGRAMAYDGLPVCPKFDFKLWQYHSPTLLILAS